MPNKEPETICIFYGPSETGPAQLITGRYARIIDHVLLDDDDKGLWQNAIVRLSRRPEEGEPPPTIDKVLWKPFESRTILTYHNDGEFCVLRGILAQLHAECFVLVSCEESKRGILAVGHDDFLDPGALADAIGIAQEDDEVTPETNKKDETGTP